MSPFSQHVFFFRREVQSPNSLGSFSSNSDSTVHFLGEALLRAREEAEQPLRADNVFSHLDLKHQSLSHFPMVNFFRFFPKKGWIVVKLVHGYSGFAI